MSKKPVIIWFRHDLRCEDNQAFANACETDCPVIPVFIYDKNAMDRDYGAAQKVFLHHALGNLKKDLHNKYGLSLVVRSGNTYEIFTTISKETQAEDIYYNRSYEVWSQEQETKLKQSFHCHDFQGNLIFEPGAIRNGSGDHYKVFTPYYKACMGKADYITSPFPAPDKAQPYKNDILSDNLDSFLSPLDWDDTMMDHWDASENGAHNRLNEFLDNGLSHYKDGRDVPSKDYTSKMSPYLRFGLISPRTIWHTVQDYIMTHDIPSSQSESYLREVFWREFCFHLLDMHPGMKGIPLQDKYKKFPWDSQQSHFKAWTKGQTGYPLIDAGMRQLWQTGWMHNRVRMLVGSFLVKHLLHPWQDGEEWFWDTLVDACPANNTAGWQWIAGCGADAAPYFRIFNPITQGDKFNAYDYVRHYVPEIKSLPDKYLFSPWETPDDILDHLNINIGKTYPKPIVSHKEARERALDAFAAIKGE